VRSSAPAARVVPALALLAIVLAAFVWLALGIGSGPVGWSDVMDLVAGRADPTAQTILVGVRLPRLVLALLVGAALSGAGAVFQAILRNPLADPYILGVSGGSALGAVLFTAIAGGVALASPVGRPLAALAGAVSTLLLLSLARVRGRTEPTTLLLVGVVLNAFDSAVILFLITAGDATLFRDALFFLVGTVRPLPWPILGSVGAFVAAGLIVLVLLSHRLNLLALGEETADHLGVRVERTTWLAVGAASLVTAAAVAFTGLVGFVGLIVPHLMRTLFGPDHRLLLPASILGGAAFVVLADTAARTVIAPAELPVGVITALVGGPFFLFLFLRHLRGREA
jgi:iron complex transport system permease protein